MARNRESAKIVKMHELQISEKELIIISWVLGAGDKGYDLTESSYVASIIEELGLDETREINPDELDNVKTFSLSGYEIRFLLDQFLDMFDQRKVTAIRAIPMVSMYRKLDNSLNSPLEDTPDA